MTISREVIQMGSIAADEVAMRAHSTGSEKTRAIVERTLEALEANGIIKIVPEEERPEFFAPYPPYEGPNLLSRPNKENVK